MAKFLMQAITDVREYYIQKLLDGGYHFDNHALSSYTLSELKKEYTMVLNKERK
jgi:hypothetical protein